MGIVTRNDSRPTSSSISAASTSTPFPNENPNAKLPRTFLRDGGSSQWKQKFFRLIDSTPRGFPPSITAQPVPLTVTEGETASFSVSVSGTPPFSFQWFNNAVPIAGATSPTFTISSVTLADAGDYSAVVKSPLHSLRSDLVPLVVNPKPTAPSIIKQPASLTVEEGQQASFTVFVAGSSPFHFQWIFNGHMIIGATSETYSIASARPVNGGNYSVLIGNSAGSVTSLGATLTVNQTIPPSITMQPTRLTITEGEAATFTVSVTGTAPFSFQWRKSGVPIPGAISETYTIPSVSDASSASYDVIIKNAAGTVASSPAALLVNPKPILPSITKQPSDQNVDQGQNVTFAVTATGTAPLTYNWFFNGKVIAGATLPTLSLQNAQPAQSGPYYVSVKNTVGEVKSAAATLIVQQLPDFAPANINGKVYTLTIVSGSSPFSSTGSFRVAAAISGNNGVLVPLTGDTDAERGTYNYTKTGPNAAQVVLASTDPTDNTIIYAQVTFKTATTGSYFATRNDSATATQTASFVETTPTNPPQSNFAPSSLAGKSLNIGITSGGGDVGIFADYGALGVSISATGNKASFIPITDNFEAETLAYTYTKTGGNTATIVFIEPATVDFPSYQMVYKLTFFSAFAGTFTGTVPGTNEQQTGNFIFE